MYIIIVGGGKVGYHLAKALLDQGHEVLVMEKRAEECEFICNQLGSVCMQGDGCEVTTLVEAGTARADMLIAATGPLTGHFLPASGKTHFGTKSPATGGYADSNMGGHFGPQLKYAGYDVLVIVGKADRPSYLFISDDTVEIRPAEAYWGQGSIVAERNLKDHLGDDYQVLTIGPAGENRVRYACISHDFGRQAGRTGVGAVMGSKNLKAIAVKGTQSIPVADLKEACAKGKDSTHYESFFGSREKTKSIAAAAGNIAVCFA